MSYLIAHRGLKDKNVKENTIDAFISAINNKNYAGFEFDVRFTLDKECVINHGPISDLKLISNTNYNDLALPRLEMVINLKTDKIFLLEIKSSNFDYDYFNELLNKYADKKIYVMSFDKRIIKKLSSFKHSYKLGVLNYVVNSDNDYSYYDFICLLESVYSDKLYDFFNKQNIEVFIYGIHKEKTYSIDKNVYLITDKNIYF